MTKKIVFEDGSAGAYDITIDADKDWIKIHDAGGGAELGAVILANDLKALDTMIRSLAMIRDWWHAEQIAKQWERANDD